MGRSAAMQGMTTVKAWLAGWLDAWHADVVDR